MLKIITMAALLVLLATPYISYAFGLRGKKMKNFQIANTVLYFLVLIGTTAVLFSGSAIAAEPVAATVATGITDKSIGLIAAALATGIATIGAGIAVASSASAALGAISEDSSLLGKTLIFVSLAEGIALYGLLVSFIILGKV